MTASTKFQFPGQKGGALHSLRDLNEVQQFVAYEILHKLKGWIELLQTPIDKRHKFIPL
jgi:hypothetical protein